MHFLYLEKKRWQSCITRCNQQLRKLKAYIYLKNRLTELPKPGRHYPPDALNQLLHCKISVDFL
ncbi:hypothetical protein AU255_07570 [Methyloprofundus sedimenti]|uniref:Uncharacterized protein n=1 Tax=Methyloprofundus sedimenti TaxID=1420851 RepID=A0A1V8M8J2_9GAMM|nr:hypothetical protein AU255_07570 [Methyloprofundus sedimenti]